MKKREFLSAAMFAVVATVAPWSSASAMSSIIIDNNVQNYEVVMATSDGGYLIAGGGSDAFVYKYSADNMEEWHTVMGGATSSPIIALGEIKEDGANAYRVVTDGGELFALDVITGDAAKQEDLNSKSTLVAKFDSEGNLFAKDSSYFYRRDWSGSVDNLEMGTISYPFGVFVYGDYVYTMRVTGEGSETPVQEIARSSKDLDRFESIATLSSEKISSIESYDDDGNFVICESSQKFSDDAQQYLKDCEKYMSYDKDGNLLAELDNSDRDIKYFVSNFVAVYTDKAVKLNKNLTQETWTAVGLDENYSSIGDATILNDGSLILVGSKTNNGVSISGLRAHIVKDAEGDKDTSDSVKDTAKNPSTLDDVQLAAVSGAAVLAGVVLAARKLFGRR